MFDIGWSELLVIGVVALLVVGPKELPALLRTIGRYMGMVKRHANEFRAQFDEAMRESELDQIRKEVESLKSDAETTLHSAEQSVTREWSDARRELEGAATGTNPGVAGQDASAAPDATGMDAGESAGPAVPAERADGPRLNGSAAHPGESSSGEPVAKSGA